MGLSVARGSFQCITTAAGNTQAIAGLGFQPKALIFWWSRRVESVDTAGGANAQKGVGFCTGTTQRCAMTAFSQDAQATSQCFRLDRNDALIVTSTTAGAVDGLMDLQSFDAGGFTMVVDDQFAAGVTVFYLAIGGTDLTNAIVLSNLVEPGATGNQGYTGAGFQPTCGLFLSDSSAVDAPSAQSDSTLALGWAKDSTHRGVVAAGGNGGAGTMQTLRYGVASECLALWNANVTAIDARADFVSWDSDGFTLNWLARAATRRFACLLLKGPNFHVGSVTTQTDTTTAMVISGLSFAPAAALFASVGAAASTPGTAVDHDMWSLGGALSNASRGALCASDEDNLADSETFTAVEFDEVYIHADLADAVDGLMDVQSFDSGGITCIMDDADPTGAFVSVLLIGPAVTNIDVTETVAEAAVSGFAVGFELESPLDDLDVSAGLAFVDELEGGGAGIRPAELVPIINRPTILPRTRRGRR